jgi:hypothetical protein
MSTEETYDDIICDVTYGSYSEKDYETVVPSDYEQSAIEAKIRRELSLNFLPMASFRVKVTSRITRSYDY